MEISGSEEEYPIVRLDESKYQTRFRAAESQYSFLFSTSSAIYSCLQAVSLAIIQGLDHVLDGCSLATFLALGVESVGRRCGGVGDKGKPAAGPLASGLAKLPPFKSRNCLICDNSFLNKRLMASEIAKIKAMEETAHESR